jgi:excisionase family DNA binding protein
VDAQAQCLEYLTVPEVAKILKISRENAYRMVKDGEIPAKVISERRIRVSAQALEDWIEAQPDAFGGQA